MPINFSQPLRINSSHLLHINLFINFSQPLRINSSLTSHQLAHQLFPTTSNQLFTYFPSACSSTFPNHFESTLHLLPISLLINFSQPLRINSSLTSHQLAHQLFPTTSNQLFSLTSHQLVHQLFPTTSNQLFTHFPSACSSTFPNHFESTLHLLPISLLINFSQPLRINSSYSLPISLLINFSQPLRITSHFNSFLLLHISLSINFSQPFRITSYINSTHFASPGTNSVTRFVSEDLAKRENMGPQKSGNSPKTESRVHGKKRSCKEQVVQRASGAKSKWCKEQVVQRASGAKSKWGKEQVVQRASGAKSKWCKELFCRRVTQ